MSEVDANIGIAWEEYLQLLNDMQFEDYVTQEYSQATSREEVMANFKTSGTILETENTPENEIEAILSEFPNGEALLESDNELVFDYETEALASLQIRLLFFDDALYYSAFEITPTEISDSMFIQPTILEEVRSAEKPTMSTFLNHQPAILGVSHMIKDQQLGSTFVVAGEDEAGSTTFESMTYLADTPLSYETYWHDTSEEADLLSTILEYQTVSNFTASALLVEFVTPYNSSNAAFKEAIAESNTVNSRFVFRNLQSEIDGSSSEEVESTFLPPAGSQSATINDNIEASTYTFTDFDNLQNAANLSLYFYDNQLAFMSAKADVSEPMRETVALEYNHPIEISALEVGQSLSSLVRHSFDMTAVATMAIESGMHQVLVVAATLEDGSTSLIFIDVVDYQIQAVTPLDPNIDYATLEQTMFQHIFEQYS